MVEELGPKDAPVPENSIEAAPEKKKASPLLWIGLGILGLTIIFYVVLLLPFMDEARIALRDASITLLVLLLLIFVMLNLWLIAVIIWGVNRLSERIDLLLQQGGEILYQVKGTATTIKGTADFVGERVASPFIGLAAKTNGIVQGLRTFFQGKRQKGGPS